MASLADGVSAQKPQKCFVCGEIVLLANHPCVDDVYNVFSDLITPKHDICKLKNLENFVFQGAGVKVYAYLGVLKELKKRDGELLCRIKRVAGASFGGLTSLYLSLNMKPGEIEDIFDTNKFKLLDDKVKLYVHPGPVEYTVKEVIEALYEKDDHESLGDFFRGDFLKYFSEHSSLGNLELTFLTNLMEYKNVRETFKTMFGLSNLIGDGDEEDVREYSSIRRCNEEPYIVTFLRGAGKMLGFSKKPPLEGEMLSNALSELVLRLLNLQKNRDEKDKDGFGLFTGEIFAKELIQDKIKKQVEKHLHLIPQDIRNKLTADAKSNPTFQDLASFECFKDLYIIAFDVNKSRSKVFSHEHTPTVLVADAVWASMCVPFFFKTKTVHERTSEGLKPYKRKDNKYLDGSILDNYPIWIFDDIKYCTSLKYNKEDAKKDIKFNNSKTLGFKLVDSERLNAYKKHLKGDKDKIITESKFLGTFSDIARLLLAATLDEHEESFFQSQGLIHRTCYIDNCGVSTFQILSDKDRKNLSQAGKKAVDEYLNREEKKQNEDNVNHVKQEVKVQREDSVKHFERKSEIYIEGGTEYNQF